MDSSCCSALQLYRSGKIRLICTLGLAGGHGCAFIKQDNVMQHRLQLCFDLEWHHISCVALNGISRCCIVTVSHIGMCSVRKH